MTLLLVSENFIGRTISVYIHSQTVLGTLVLLLFPHQQTSVGIDCFHSLSALFIPLPFSSGQLHCFLLSRSVCYVWVWAHGGGCLQSPEESGLLVLVCVFRESNLGPQEEW